MAHLIQLKGFGHALNAAVFVGRHRSDLRIDDLDYERVVLFCEKSVRWTRLASTRSDRLSAAPAAAVSHPYSRDDIPQHYYYAELVW